ncbi:MAG: hypothetical protein GWP36_00590 [Bacteroidetes bacterium]|nr:hypothetical protein [Bacteroidota bacterium]
MTDHNDIVTGLNYELLVEASLRMVVRSALHIAASDGLPGDTHFYIAFKTGYPGVEIEDDLRANHPDNITIVLQHQYADLVVEDEEFSVTLFFGGKPSAMTVPFAAVTSFNDPSVGFGLQFETDDDEDDIDDADDGNVDGGNTGRNAANPRAGDTAARGSKNAARGKNETADVVSLDSFRKTPS